MNIETRNFGAMEIAEDKILTFQDGLIGFPDLKKFTLIVDEESEDRNKIFWLQSLEDGEFALPIVDPFAIFEEYNPVVEEEWFNQLGEFEQEDLLVLLTMTVPKDITQISVNQKAPIVINSNTNKACQIIVEGDDYQVRCPVYDILKAQNEKEGE